MSLPDFFIIGAMKCGTSSLHDQLASQPGVFMSTPKEPNFFSDDDVYAKGLDWYRGLFADAPASALKGESSTHYTKLPTHPATIGRLASAVPRAQFIYVMRHPIDRLVSHYMHEWSQNVLTDPIDDAVASHPPLVDYGRYAYQLRPWIERFGRAAIMPIFFERMTAAPQETLSQIGAFLGLEGLVWRNDLEASNVSSARIRKFPLYDLVVDHPAAAALRRTLVPRSLRDAIKRNLQMAERPDLSPETRARLAAIFDEDLAELGAMLGADLNCNCFKDKATERALGWL